MIDLQKFTTSDELACHILMKIREHLIIVINDAREKGFSDYACRLYLELKDDVAIEVLYEIWIYHNGLYYKRVDSQRFECMEEKAVKANIVKGKTSDSAILRRDELDIIFEDRHMPVLNKDKDVIIMCMETLDKMGMTNNNFMATVTDLVIFYKITMGTESGENIQASLLATRVAGLNRNNRERLENNHQIRIAL